jgi:ribonuclease BN (tRNA processing enzyme)
MTSRITFLGTAGDSFLIGKQLRASGGFVVQQDELQFHIDPGPGALVRLNQQDINVRATTAILISKDHVHFCNDVNALIDAMTYSGLDKTGVLVSNSSLINGTEIKDPYVTELHKSYLEKFIALMPGQKLGIEDVEILALNTGLEESIGFKFITSEFTLCYSSDAKYSKELAKEYEGADILILNIRNPSGEKEENCLNADDAVKIISKVAPKLTIITGFGIKMVKADPIYVAREIQKQTGCAILCAKDGLIVNPVSYSAKTNQKRLSSFEEPKPEIREPYEPESDNQSN